MRLDLEKTVMFGDISDWCFYVPALGHILIATKYQKTLGLAIRATISGPFWHSNDVPLTDKERCLERFSAGLQVLRTVSGDTTEESRLADIKTHFIDWLANAESSYLYGDEG